MSSESRRSPLSSWLCAGLLLCACATAPGCATNHLIQWSKGQPSMFPQPTDRKKPFVHPAGTVVLFPAMLVWDIATAPFQFLWDTYPYGEELHPKDEVK